MSATLSSGLLSLAQGILLLALAPALIGLLGLIEAGAQGRRRAAASLFQPYRLIVSGRDQRSIRPQTGAWLFPLGPVALFVSYGALLFATPAFGHAPFLRIDLIAVMYLLTLARFASALAALDGTNPVASVNTARAMFLHLHTELGLALFLAGVALNAGVLDIAALNRDQTAAAGQLWLSPQWLLLAAAFAVIVMYEAGRVPVGNAEGELELPKGQEGIPDHYGGQDLLLIRWAEAARLTFLLFLGISLFPWPQAGAPALTVLIRLAQLLVAVALLAFWEASRPRVRLRKVGGPMLLSAVFSLTAILYTLVAGGS